MDLADPAERLQMPGQLRPPHRDPDPVIALGERPDHVPAQKARSSENRDQRVQIRCHGVNFLGSNSIDRGDILVVSRYANSRGLYSGFGPHLSYLTSARPIRTNRAGPRWRNW